MNERYFNNQNETIDGHTIDNYLINYNYHVMCENEMEITDAVDTAIDALFM